MEMAVDGFDQKVVKNALARAAADEAKALRKLEEIGDKHRRWHLVQIGQASFKLARDQLDWAGYKLYAPMIREMIMPKSRQLPLGQRRNRHLFATEKLSPYFGSYRFVRFNADTDPWHDLFKLIGVHGIGVAPNRLPVPMPDALINELKAKEQNGAIPAETRVKSLYWKAGDKARVNNGAFSGFTGKVNRVDEAGRIRLLLDLFARVVPVDLTADDVDKVAS